jgi:hypothetical protein
LATFACCDFTVPEELVDYFDMRYEHPSATVPLHSQLVQDFSGVFSLLGAAGILLPAISNHFSAGEASHRNNH